MSERDTVTLSRAEYEALLNRLEETIDNNLLEVVTARERELGKDAARSDYLPLELVELLCAGEHPIRVWRKYRGLTRETLAAAAGVAPSYLTEIETRKKPGSFHALAKLAAALKISLDDIAVWTSAGR
jgi:DNA-binding XRE family transcriptional regulator